MALAHALQTFANAVTEISRFSRRSASFAAIQTKYRYALKMQFGQSSGWQRCGRALFQFDAIHYVAVCALAISSAV
jgi:hypothetical protein